MQDHVFKLIVHEKVGKIIQHFQHWDDAKQTFESTYSKVTDKPRYEIEKIEVLQRATHL